MLRLQVFGRRATADEILLSYNEATILARATNDYAWQAAAIEANIMTQVYQSWTHIPPVGTFRLLLGSVEHV